MEENEKLPRVISIVIVALLLVVSFHVLHRDGTEDEAMFAYEEENEEDTRSSIEFKDTEYTIDASQYDLPIDLTSVDELDHILNYYPINDTQREFLRTHGFVNLGRSSIYHERGYYDLVTLYQDLEYLGLPPYITTDAMLHVYHIYFDEILKNIEEEFFFDDLKRMTRELINSTHGQLLNVTAATVDITHVYKADPVPGPVGYTITETIDLKEAALKNLAYLYVALKILDPTTVVPSSVKEYVNAEMVLINAHGGFFRSPIFDKGEVHYILTYIEDYSQYKPRGHYTRSELLERYFNAMMWYGRMSFRMKSAMETVQAVLLSEALNTQTARMWDSIYTATSFFVGRSDDLTPDDYRKLTASVFGTVGGNYSKLLNTKLIRLYLDKIPELRKPRICSSFVRADMEDIVNATMGLRLMGQRLVPDSYMFQNLVFPSVLDFEGTGMPFTLSEIVGWGPGKGFPRGLEAMAILGNEIAEDFLIRDGDHQYDRYESQYGKLKAEFSGINGSTWESNLYWGWLHALDSLNEDFTASNYPTYMRNRGYLAQKLNTDLGSWTELRHDTILYAKQSYTPTYGISEPVGYVEPIPDLYSRLKDLTIATKETMQDLDLISTSTADDLDQFSTILGKLEDFSERELNNVPLDPSEYEFIQFFGTNLDELLENVPDDAGDSRLVADVHTDPNIDPKDGNDGKVLEEATGEFDLILVIWNDTANDDSGILRASCGPIFTYYEFKQPMEDRLTDEEWKDILESNIGVPAKFDWQDHPMDYPPLVDETKYYDLWVSTEEIYFSKTDTEDKIDITSLIHNREDLERYAHVSLYLDSVEESALMHTFDITVPGSGMSLVEYEWDASSEDDTLHRIYVNISTDDDNDYKTQNNLAMGFVDLSNVSGPSQDRDGDGVLDGLDAFPFDPAASVDTDGDGYPDRWNPGRSKEDSTTGLMLDGFPNDPFEWADSDGDGIGDNSDLFPLDPLEWSDRDGDGFGDNSDVFPDDPLEWMDTDGDGHGDNSDSFPNDPTEWSDRDGDGWGDNKDMFPDDPSAWFDSDLDGYHDGIDVFPKDPLEWSDRDGDGFGDNCDEFPDDPLEWKDSDGDLVGDNSDVFLWDPDEWSDSDGDGVGDNSDAFPLDPAASVDTDKDGYPDRWNPGKSEEDSTTGLKIDMYPDDRDRWDSIGTDEDVDGNDMYILLALAALVSISLLVILSLVVRQRSSGGGERLTRYWNDVVNDRIKKEDMIADEELHRLLRQRLDDENISMETYQDIMWTHLGDEY